MTAQGISAGTAETQSGSGPQDREPGSAGMRPNTVATAGIEAARELLTIRDGKRVPADVAARQLMGLYYELGEMPDMAAAVRGPSWEVCSSKSERDLLAVMASLVVAVREEEAALSLQPASVAGELTQADRDAANEWAFIECRHCSEYEGDFPSELAEAFAKHRLAAAPALNGKG